MTLQDALTKIINIGIEAMRRDYDRPDQHQKRQGSIHGFNECRNKSVSELAALLAQAGTRMLEAHRDQAEDYWYWRCRQAEIDWVCNVVSAILVNEGLPVIVQPTARGILMADKILKLSEAA